MGAGPATRQAEEVQHAKHTTDDQVSAQGQSPRAYRRGDRRGRVGGLAIRGLAPRAASAASARPSMGGIFGGYAAKDWPVVIEISRNGKRVKRAVAGLESPCASGAMLSVPDEWRNVPIRKRHFKGDYDNAETEGGLVYQYTASISGGLNGKRTKVSGTWSSRVVVRGATGATVDTCRSGPVAFTARRE